MASVPAALDQIKHQLASHLPPERIEAACRAAGHRWRRRRLGPVPTLHLFLLQVLHGNTAIRHLRHLIDQPLNAAAYCRARIRLPLVALQALLRDSADRLRQQLAREAGEAISRWRGHRTLLIDGSSTIVPDQAPLRRTFKQPHGRRPRCGFPVPKVLGLFDAATGLVLEVMAFSLFVNEHARAWLLHPLIAAGDLLIGDRGFCSYTQLALLAERGVLAVFRMRQTQIVSFRPHRKHFSRLGAASKLHRYRGRPRSRFVKRLGKHDQIVAWLKPKPTDGPPWMSRSRFVALPQELLVREVRYRVGERGHRTRCVTIATTLLDPLLYPKDAIAGLYNLRWQVETHWRELKTVLKMRRLKCRSEAGVKKELAVYALVYNLVRAVMARAAARQQTQPDRISFIDALRWLCSGASIAELQLELIVNPPRPGRYEPRVMKDYFDTFQRMTRPRNQLRTRTARRNAYY